jgi:hypothetical protein
MYISWIRLAGKKDHKRKAVLYLDHRDHIDRYYVPVFARGPIEWLLDSLVSL